MKLSASTALLLISSIVAWVSGSSSVPKPSAPPIYQLTYNGKDLAVDGSLTDIKECGSAKIKDSLKTNAPRICLDQDTQLSASHIPGADLSPEGAQLLLRYFSGWHNNIKIDFADPDRVMDANPVGMESLVGLVTKDNVSVFADAGLLPALIHLKMDKVKSDGKVESANESSKEKMIGFLEDEAYLKVLNQFIRAHKPSLIRFLSLTPSSKLKANGAAILEQLSAPGITLKELPAERVFGPLAANPENCEKIATAQLVDLDHDVAALLKSSCINAIPKIEEFKGWTVAIRSIPEGEIASLSPLDQSAYKFMTRKQIGKLGTKVEKGVTPCRNVPLGDYLAANGQEMKPECFAGALETSDATGIVIGPAFLALPKEILSKVVDMASLAKLHADNWKYVSIEQKQPLFADAAKCGELPEGILDWHNMVNIASADCFANLHVHNQARALVNATLPEDALSGLSADKVKDWQYNDATGILVLQEASHVANIGPMVAQMSSKTSGDNVCMLIDNKDTLLKLKVVQSYGSKECFQAKKVQITIKDLADLDPHVREVVPTDELVEAMTRSDYGDIDAQVLSSLAGSSKICSGMSPENFEALDDDKVLKVFPSKCLAALPQELLEGISKRKYELMPPEAFADLVASQVTKSFAEKLTDAQFGRVSSAVTDKTKHHASQWDKDTVAGFTTARVPLIHASAWAACPEAAYEGLGEDAFQAIPPDNMVDMTAEQLDKVPAASRAKISEAQVAQVGKKHASAAKHPLQAFASVTVPEPVRKAIDARLAAETTPSEPAPAA